jgi:hypothetical protein
MRPPDIRGRSWAPLAARWIPRIGLAISGFLLLSRLVPRIAEKVTGDTSGRGTHAQQPSAEARAAGHETHDVNALTLGKLAIGMLFGAAVIMGGMVLLNRLLHRVTLAEHPSLTAEQIAPLPPPAPNLQADPLGDLARLRAGEDALLDTYAWIDPAHTRARIPIQRAMTLMVGRPLDSAP